MEPPPTHLGSHQCTGWKGAPRPSPKPFQAKTGKKIYFAPIPDLPQGFWDDPKTVETYWGQDISYLWGANDRNYKGTPFKLIVGSGMAGMAGTEGSTCGLHHPRYVGIVTMAGAYAKANKEMFDLLDPRIKAGESVVIPTFHGKFSLGTGIGGSQSDWLGIQKNIWAGLVHLIESAAQTAHQSPDEILDIPAGAFWPDCSKVSSCGAISKSTHPNAHPIKNFATIQGILAGLN